MVCCAHAAAGPWRVYCPCQSAQHDLQPFLASGELSKVRRDMHSAKRAVGWQVGVLCLAVFGLLTTRAGAQAPAAVPVFQITPVESKITFHVDASVTIEGTFDQWEASLTFTSTAAESAVLDVKIQAASVNTGSGLKDRTLKGDDFFSSTS